jgi:hypothetical protein
LINLRFSLTFFVVAPRGKRLSISSIIEKAGMAELADAADSKS